MIATIGITGGTGFIGSHLADLLKRHDYHVIIFTRSPKKGRPSSHIQYAYWNPSANKIDLNALKQVHGMVHLAGAGIADKRWTKKRKKEIVSSRVDATHFLVSQLRQYAPLCKTLVAASAMGYYGADRLNRPFVEEDGPGTDFLARTCVRWEAASQSANDFLRTVIFRFGHVLGKDGGAFPKFVQPMKFGLVPVLGSGRQVMSWIHIDDHAKLLFDAVTKEQYNGIYNAVAPHPVSFTRMMKVISHKRGGFRILAHVPSPVLKLALGEMSRELVKSICVSPDKLLSSGFEFQYPALDKAVAQILSE